MKQQLLTTTLLLFGFFAQARIIISEIMYHPAVEDTSMDDGLFEYIEFTNTADTAVDMSGYLIESGVVYLFPEGSIINPGEYLVLVSDSNSFKSRYPGVQPFDVYSGRLNNGGETVSVITNLGQSVTKVAYNDASPWPSIADGFGFSLVPIDEDSPLSQKDADYWSASTGINGSPGSASIPANNNFDVYINEVLSSPIVDGNDMVEIHNAGTEDVDISYWYLTDNRGNPKKYRFPQGTIIAAGGYHTVTEFTINPFDLGFSFSSKGDQAYIFSADVDSNLTGYSHGFSFDAQERGVSFGRHVNSQEGEYFVKQISQTFGADNAGPAVGPLVIDKIMYEPSIWENEFITIRNISQETQPLYNTEFPDSNEYRVTGIDFKFPFGSQVSLAPDEYLIIAQTHPDTFRFYYNIPDEIQVFEFTSSLSNQGENVSLQAPLYRDTLLDGSYDHHYMVIDEVRYNDKAPWPFVSANSQYLVREPLTSFGTEPLNWTSTFDPLVGLEDDNGKISNISVYPTNVIGNITIEGMNSDDHYVQVLNTLGHEVMNTTTKDNTLSVSTLSTGYYILYIDKEYAFKIYKQ